MRKSLKIAHRINRFKGSRTNLHKKAENGLIKLNIEKKKKKKTSTSICSKHTLPPREKMAITLCGEIQKTSCLLDYRSGLHLQTYWIRISRLAARERGVWEPPSSDSGAQAPRSPSTAASILVTCLQRKPVPVPQSQNLHFSPKAAGFRC